MNKVMGLLISVVLMGLLACAVPATAAQSFFGYTGLVRIPTADVLSPGEFALGAYFLNFDPGPNAAVFAATGSFFPNLELGLGVVSPERGDTDVLANAKYRFIPETIATPGVSAGLTFTGRDSDASGYLVVSKTLSTPDMGDVPNTSLSGHLGIAVGDDLEGVFGGLSATLGDKLTLMVEHDTDDLNIGARLAISQQLRLHGALLGGDSVGFGISFYAGL